MGRLKANDGAQVAESGEAGEASYQQGMIILPGRLPDHGGSLPSFSAQ